MDIQGCHLSSTSKFPDFSLTFYSFPYPMSDPEIFFFILYLNGANCITSNLGLLLKERICSPWEQTLSLRVAPNEEGDGLRLFQEREHPFLS